MKKFSSTEVLAMATEHPWNDQARDSNPNQNFSPSRMPPLDSLILTLVGKIIGLYLS